MNSHSILLEDQNDVQTQTAAGYEQKEREDLCRRIADFHARFKYIPDFQVYLNDQGQTTPVARRPEPVASSVTPSDLSAMERRILDALSNRKPPKPETQSPFIRRKEAVKLLG